MCVCVCVCMCVLCGNWAGMACTFIPCCVALRTYDPPNDGMPDASTCEGCRRVTESTCTGMSVWSDAVVTGRGGGRVWCHRSANTMATATTVASALRRMAE